MLDPATLLDREAGLDADYLDRLTRWLAG